MRGRRSSPAPPSRPGFLFTDSGVGGPGGGEPLGAPPAGPGLLSVSWERERRRRPEAKAPAEAPRVSEVSGGCLGPERSRAGLGGRPGGGGGEAPGQVGRRRRERGDDDRRTPFFFFLDFLSYLFFFFFEFFSACRLDFPLRGRSKCVDCNLRSLAAAAAKTTTGCRGVCVGGGGCPSVRPRPARGAAPRSCPGDLGASSEALAVGAGSEVAGAGRLAAIPHGLPGAPAAAGPQVRVSNTPHPQRQPLRTSQVSGGLGSLRMGPALGTERPKPQRPTSLKSLEVGRRLAAPAGLVDIMLRQCLLQFWGLPIRLAWRETATAVLPDFSKKDIMGSKTII